VLPESLEWEVLVVDNNSDDLTRQVVSEYCGRHRERFHYLFEPEAGKSHALNKGIMDALGSVLAFLDDDVAVDPHWLWNLTAELRGDKWAGAGGRILPSWSCSQPRWLPTEDRHGLAPIPVFDRGLVAGPLSEPPYGTNMAFPRRIFVKYGGFRTDLGPSPGRRIRHAEDSEFGQRLLSAGEQLLYQPNAIVYHPVTKERLKKRYFLGWWHDKGRADAQAYGLPADGRMKAMGVPLRLFPKLVALFLRWMTARRLSRRFLFQTRVWYITGQIAAHFRRWRSKSISLY
jgi:GT2 family glycosyltransferase